MRLLRQAGLVISHPLTAVIAAAALAGAAGAACAQVDLLSPETVHGLVDVRIAAADGEASFVDGGFGKTLYGGTNDGGWRAQADLAEVGLEWRPRFSWELSAVVEAIAQPGQMMPRFIINKRRPGRIEPRVKKRRPKPFDLMSKPRQQLRNALKNSCV